MASPTRILWFRRDLRLTDHPALLNALGQLPPGPAEGPSTPGSVVPLFVIDPLLWDAAGPVRRARLAASLAALDRDLRARGASLCVRHGDPTGVVPGLAREVGADEVHVSADFAPYGARRDDAVATVLERGGGRLVRTGSPYAVAPGRVTKPDGSAYAVYTPFHRAWMAHGWRTPLPTPHADAQWVAAAGDGLPTVTAPTELTLPAAGESHALDRWQHFRCTALADYADHRDRPDLAGTSTLSDALRWGELHPRTLLADLDESRGHEVFRKELAWREFYADVLHHHPKSARQSLRSDMAGMRTDVGPTADERFLAWAEGRTGYPFVDAGMRQLRAEGWMHNRVRMVVASFLVKDLHLDWQRGAQHFMHWLRDGDLASNQHGWQWAAGTGTDAAPYFRVFNPVLQGHRYDPDGDYVRRYVPELGALAGAAAHTPWEAPLLAPDYPPPMVDHQAERAEALARLEELKEQRPT
jgi:deoxyribodipyrimidine photo-lyase